MSRALADAAAPLLESVLSGLRRRCDEQFRRTLADLAGRGLADSGVGISALKREIEAVIPEFEGAFLDVISQCLRLPEIRQISRDELLIVAGEVAGQVIGREIRTQEVVLEKYAKRCLTAFPIEHLRLGRERTVRDVKAKLNVMIRGGVMFDDLMDDRLTVRKADGRQWEGVKASVQGRKVIVIGDCIHFERGDTVLRTLPSGATETFIVEFADFQNAPIASMRHYTLRVRRDDEPPKPPSSIHLSGANARVNIGATDNSVNISQPTGVSIFPQIRSALSAAEPTDDLRRIQETLEKLEAAVGTPSYLSRYQEFVEVVANHVTIVAPFLPALARLL